jgi:hypothetical protein
MRKERPANTNSGGSFSGSVIVDRDNQCHAEADASGLQQFGNEWVGGGATDRGGAHLYGERSYDRGGGGVAGGVGE